MDVLERILWSGIVAGLSAAASLGARRVATTIWRLAAREEPPAER